MPTEDPIRIVLNGEQRSLDGIRSIEALIDHLDLDSRRIAVELNLQILKRSDFGDTPLNDGDRIELGATLTLGRLYVEAEAFEFRERMPSMSERTTRGFTWSVSTQFDGWLPVFTGTRRSGMIR